RVRGGKREAVPVWCPWPLPRGWTVTGIAWAGDERTGPRATALCLSGPAPLGEGPADAVFVAEEPGGGLGPPPAGSPGPDRGPAFPVAVQQNPAPAKVRVEGSSDSTVAGRVAARPECLRRRGTRGLALRHHLAGTGGIPSRRIDRPARPRPIRT